MSFTIMKSNDYVTKYHSKKHGLLSQGGSEIPIPFYYVISEKK